MKRPESLNAVPRRFIYAKGGSVVQEAQRLLSGPVNHDIPKGGPDLFLLAMGRLVNGGGKLLLTSVGNTDLHGEHNQGMAKEYGARPSSGPALFRRLAYGRALLRIVKDALVFKPDYIFSGVEGPFAVAYFVVSALLRIPFVQLVHVGPDQKSLSKLTLFCNRLTIKRADVVIVHGPYLRDCVIRLGTAPNKVIEFDTGTDLPALFQERAPTLTPSFVFAGRIEVEKGIFDLLEAFHTLRQTHQGQLIYFGEGSATDALVQAVEASPYATDIAVRGKAPQNIVFSEVAKATASVTPTRSIFPEGRCMTALESIALGTPVIAPDFGPFPYAVTSGANGLLYEADNVNALASCMLKVVADPHLQNRLKDGARNTQAQTQPFTSFFEALELAMKGH